jgi:hypothetical protein
MDVHSSVNGEAAGANGSICLKYFVGSYSYLSFRGGVKMRKWLLIVLVLLAPHTSQAASSFGSALLGIGVGAIAGVFVIPYALPTAVATAPAVMEALSTASATVGEAIVADPAWAGGIIGGLLGYWLAP